MKNWIARVSWPAVRQVITRRVTEHVWVNRKLDVCDFPGLSHNVMDRAPRHRGTTQRGEDIRRRAVALLAPPGA
jgi:hypothetical protein